jgi:hypothetical protein
MPSRTPPHPAPIMTSMPAADLWNATAALHASGRSLMERVLPSDGSPPEIWLHYPTEDAVGGPMGARWFYHCHDGGSRPADEHGHFHLFVARRALPRRTRPLIAPAGGRRPRPSTVHIAALIVDRDGLPRRWLATNRWVTDEWLYPAAAIAPLLPHIAFAGADGDALVNAWLGAMVRASAPILADLLVDRDRQLICRDPVGEDRTVEIVAQRSVDLDALVDDRQVGEGAWAQTPW